MSSHFELYQLYHDPDPPLPHKGPYRCTCGCFLPLRPNHVHTPIIPWEVEYTYDEATGDIIDMIVLAEAKGETEYSWWCQRCGREHDYSDLQ